MIQHNNCYIWWSAPRQGIFPSVAHIVSVPLSRSSCSTSLDSICSTNKVEAQQKVDNPSFNTKLPHYTALATVLLSVMCNV